jgi:protein-L-isoaspartate O-methyltransferase
MVARLEESGDLGPGPVRDALLTLPREVLMPQAYVRRSAPDETPPRWDLLDWARPEDREELSKLLHSGDSVPIQHEGEAILGRVPEPRRGGAMTSMSSIVGMTAGLLQQLDLRPGQRVLDVGCAYGRPDTAAGTSPPQGRATSGRRSRTSPPAGGRPAHPRATGSSSAPAARSG